MSTLARNAVVLCGILLATPAGAEEVELFDRVMPVTSRALEIAVGTGYVQGSGHIGESQGHVQDVSGPGGAVEVRVGYRATPRLAVGVHGSYARLEPGIDLPSGSEVRGGTAGLYADWHFRPSRVVDPWIGASTAWRGLWLVPGAGKNTSYQGWEIARLVAGVDLRVSPEIAIGPVIGASVSTFLVQDSPQTGGYQNLSDPGASVFFFGGLQARFGVVASR